MIKTHRQGLLNWINSTLLVGEVIEPKLRADIQNAVKGLKPPFKDSIETIHRTVPGITYYEIAAFLDLDGIICEAGKWNMETFGGVGGITLFKDTYQFSTFEEAIGASKRAMQKDDRIYDALISIPLPNDDKVVIWSDGDCKREETRKYTQARQKVMSFLQEEDDALMSV